VSKAGEGLRNAHGVTVTPDASHLYVTDTERNQVAVLRTTNLRSAQRIPVGSTPWNTAFTADGAAAYVTNANDNTVSVINTASHRVTDRIGLGSGTTTDSNASFAQVNQIPTAISLSPDGKIWVACNTSSSLVVIDPSSNSVVRSIDIGIADEPTGIAFA
jgi:phospholipase C